MLLWFFLLNRQSFWHDHQFICPRHFVEAVIIHVISPVPDCRCSCFTELGSSSNASPGLLCVCFCLRRATKETLAETSSSITESLMSISRMMAEQVNQSEDTISTLGKKKLCFCPCVCVFLSGLQLVQSVSL